MTRDPTSSSPLFSDNEKLKVDDENFFKFLTTSGIHKILHRRYLMRKFETLDPEEQEKFKLQMGHVALFDIHTTCFPGFLRHVRKQIRKTKWYQTQIKTLAFLITLDLLYGEKATLKKAKEEMDFEKTTREYERVNERTRRRFFEYYPELLSRPLREAMRDLDDDREAPFNTIFTKPSIGDMSPTELETMHIPLDRYDIGFMQIQEMMMPLYTNYRMVEPYDTEELIGFHNYIQNILEEIIQRHGSPKEENRWIYNHLKRGTTLTENIFQTIMLSVLDRWFRKKQPSAREKLLHMKPRLKYTREDAENAVKYTNEWFRDSTLTFNTIQRGVHALRTLKPEATVWLFQECLKQLQMDPEDLGLCYHNLAIEYRDLGKPRKYKIHLQDAMKVWEEIGSQYDIGVTWAFLSEAYLLEGKLKKAQQAQEDSMVTLGKLNDNEPLSWGYLHLADTARRTNNLDWEYKTLFKGFEHSLDQDNEIFLNYYNGRLLALDQGRDPFMLEKMGLLKRPPMLPWIKIGSIFQSVLPRKEIKPA